MRCRKCGGRVVDTRATSVVQLCRECVGSMCPRTPEQYQQALNDWGWQ